MRSRPRSRLGLSVVLVGLFATRSHAQSIFTVAGAGRDDGRPATFATLNYPVNVAIGPDGDLFIVERDANRVRRVDAETGIISTIAGNGGDEFSGDGGPARGASLSRPRGVAVDNSGNVFIADDGNYRVRRVDAESGIITTVAGSDEFDVPEDGRRATEVFLGGVSDVAVDPNGRFYFEARNRVWRVSPSDGRLRSVAGNGEFGSGGDGGPATLAELYDVTGIFVDEVGNLLIADRGSSRVRRVDGTTGIIRTIAGGGTSYADGIPATAALVYPVDVDVDSLGRIVFSDTSNSHVRVVEPATGLIGTIAGKPGFPPLGDGGPATAANLVTPAGIAITPNDDLYIVTNTLSYTPDFDLFNPNRVRKVDASSGTINTFAGGNVAPSGDGGRALDAILLAPEGLVMDGEGNFYVSELGRNVVRRIDATSGIITRVAGNEQHANSGDGGPAVEAGVSRPTGLALDRLGNLYIGQYSRIRRVGSNGMIDTIAGTGVQGFSGDGGPATEARLENVRGLAMDPSDGLLIADQFNHRIRRIDLATGIITTVAGNGQRGFTGNGGPATAARLDNPWDVAVDDAGNIYIADGSYTIRRVDLPAGTIQTIAGTGRNGFSGDGGPATQAMLGRPSGVATARDGTVFVADTFNDRVRRISGGTISTYVGSGSSGVAGDDGPASRAVLGSPADVIVDGDGSLFITQSDTIFDRYTIRFVPACRPIEPPTLTSPSDDSSGITTAPSLSWNIVKGAFRYDVYLDTASPPRTVGASNIGTNSFSPSNLQPLTTYYWRIVAKGDPFCTPFRTSQSETRSFTTTSMCAPPGE